VKFTTDMFVKFDANDDGVLSFEEFKGLYNAAVDDAAGNRRSTKANGAATRTKHGLDEATLAAREKMKEEKARKKAEEAEKIRKQNAEMKERLRAQHKGKDPKALEAEVERARREGAEKRAEAKKQERERIQAEAAELESRKAGYAS